MSKEENNDKDQQYSSNILEIHKNQNNNNDQVEPIMAASPKVAESLESDKSILFK